MKPEKTPIPYQWEKSYAQKRAERIGLPDDLNLAYSTSGKDVFFLEPTPDKKDNVLIRAFYDNGAPQVYNAGERTVDHQKIKQKGVKHQIRHKVPFTDSDTDKKVKYTISKGAGKIIFFPYLYYKKFGDHQHNHVVIVEGPIKALALQLIGVPAIGTVGLHSHLQSEYGVSRKGDKYVKDADFPEELKDYLQRRNVKSVVLLHDQDAPDNMNRKDRAKMFFSSIRWTAKACSKSDIEFSYKHIAKGIEGKGIDDLLESNPGGTEGIRDALLCPADSKYFKSFSGTAEGLRKAKLYFQYSGRVNHVLEYEKYFSEIAAQVIGFIHKHDRLIIQSETGSGKTYAFVKEICSELEGRSVILVPTRAAARQIAKKYDIPVVLGGSKEEDINFAKSSKVVVCVYNSFSKISGSFENVIIDEAHTLTSQYAIKRKAAIHIQKEMSRVDKVVMLSATPDLLFCNDGFTYLRADRSSQKTKTLKYCITENAPEETVVNHIRKHKSDNRRFIFKINDIDKIRQVKKFLLSTGYQEEEVVTVFRDDNTEEDPDFNLLLSEEHFRKEVKVVLTTSIINEGVNIYEQYGRSVHMVNIETMYFSVLADLIQYLNRIRLDDERRQPEGVEYFTYHRKVKKDKEPADIDLDNLHNYYRRLASVKAEGMAEGFPGLSDDGNNTSNQFTEHQRVTIFNDHSQEYEPNLFAVKADTYQAMSLYTTDQFFEELAAAFPQYQLEEVKDTEAKADESKQLGSIKEEQEARKAQAMSELYQLAEQDHIKLLESIYHQSQDSDLRRILKSAFMFGRNQSSESEELQENYSALFESYSKELNQFAKYFTRLKNQFLDTSDIMPRVFSDGGLKIANSEHFYKFYNHLTVMMLFFIADFDKSLLSKAEAKDLERFKHIRNTFISYLKDKFNPFPAGGLAYVPTVPKLEGATIQDREPINADEITEVFKKIQKGKQKRYSQKKEAELIKILFTVDDTQRDKDRKKLYQLEGLSDMATFCQLYDIDFQGYKSKVESVLKQRQSCKKEARNALKDNELRRIDRVSDLLIKATPVDAEKTDEIPPQIVQDFAEAGSEQQRLIFKALFSNFFNDEDYQYCKKLANSGHKDRIKRLMDYLLTEAEKRGMTLIEPAPF